VDASIYVIAEEEIVSVRQLASHLKKLYQVIELAVSVSAYSDGCTDFHTILLFFEDFLCFCYEGCEF
jgi:hypothetical protein